MMVRFWFLRAVACVSLDGGSFEDLARGGVFGEWGVEGGGL